MRSRIAYFAALIAALILAPVRADVVRTTPRAIPTVRPLYTTVTPVATTGTTEETLLSYTLPGGTLGNAGDAVWVECWASSIANTNSKSLNVYFGATQISGKTITISSGVLNDTATVARVTATTQTSWGRGGGNASGTSEAIAIWQTAPAETLASDIVIACKGTTPTAAADLTARGMIVTLRKAQ